MAPAEVVPSHIRNPAGLASTERLDRFFARLCRSSRIRVVGRRLRHCFPFQKQIAMASRFLRPRVVPALLVLAAGPFAQAQIHAPAVNLELGFKNVVAFGGSVGSPYTRDAYFWGVTADYTRLLDRRWSTTLSLAFDREFERRQAQPTKLVNTLTVIGTFNYGLTRWLTATTGLGKGIVDDDNRDRKMRFTDGDWSTGVALGFSLPDLPFTNRDAVVFSTAWEWNITQAEPSVSVDLGISLGSRPNSSCSFKPGSHRRGRLQAPGAAVRKGRRNDDIRLVNRPCNDRGTHGIRGPSPRGPLPSQSSLGSSPRVGLLRVEALCAANTDRVHVVVRVVD